MDADIVRRLLPVLLAEQRARTTSRLVRREARFAEIPGKIEAAVGVRRAGKTCFMLGKLQQLIASGAAEEQVLFLGLDDDRLSPLDSAGLSTLVDEFYALSPTNHHRTCTLFFDEIHLVQGWSRYLRRLRDTRDVRIYVSGSSAKLLSKEIATELRGRSVATEVYPYSFSEYLAATGQLEPKRVAGQAERDRVRAALRAYLQCGGFPETVGLPPWQRRSLLQGYVDAVVFRDIVERHGITNIAAARYLTRTLLASAGRLLSVHKLHNDLKSQGRRLSKDTLYDYAAYFEDAYLFFLVPLYSDSVRRVEVNPRKVYAVDPGLAAAFHVRPEMDLGHLFENLVYLDLRRRHMQLSYYLTATRREVDFVAQTRDGGLELYQVCFDISDAATLKREKEALRDAEDELGIKGRLITPDNYGEFCKEQRTL
jgi:uncharacterized protein